MDLYLWCAPNWNSRGQHLLGCTSFLATGTEHSVEAPLADSKNLLSFTCSKVSGPGPFTSEDAWKSYHAHIWANCNKAVSSLSPGQVLSTKLQTHCQSCRGHQSRDRTDYSLLLTCSLQLPSQLRRMIGLIFKLRFKRQKNIWAFELHSWGKQEERMWTQIKFQ